MYKELSIYDQVDAYTLENVVSSLKKSNAPLAEGVDRVTFGNALIDNVFSYGNAKLSDDIAIFSLMCGSTCLNCKDCLKTCYAKKALIYPNAYNKRTVLTYLARYELETLEFLIEYELSHKTAKKGVKLCRIHESGDFFNQAYVDMWTRICKNHKEIKFYFYTKSEDILDMTELIGLVNVNRVKSILPNGEINYGDMSFIERMHEAFPNIPICRYGFVNAEGEKEKPMCGKCKICLNSESVMFLEH